MPAVSIIVPLYNRQRLVRDTLDSVQNQTFEDWECIVVDDHSTDGALETVQQFSDRDHRMKVFRRQSLNKGASACRNEGFEASTGKFVIFLDSDDILMPHCLEGRLAAIGEKPDLQFLVVSGRLFDRSLSDSVGRFRRVGTFTSDLDRFLVKLNPWQTTGPLWRRSTVRDVGRWNEFLRSWQDSEYHIRALLDAPHYEYREEPDYWVRRPEGESIGSNRHSPEKLRGHESMLHDLVQLLRSDPRHEERYPLLAVRHWNTVQRWTSVSRSDALRLWRTTHERGLVSSSTYRKGRLLLNVSTLPRFGDRVRRESLPAFARANRLLPECWVD
jgi:glycosyltransferase involved in cell wall biosynthesis